MTKEEEILLDRYLQGNLNAQELEYIEQMRLNSKEWAAQLALYDELKAGMQHYQEEAWMQQIEAAKSNLTQAGFFNKIPVDHLGQSAAIKTAKTPTANKLSLKRGLPILLAVLGLGLAIWGFNKLTNDTPTIPPQELYELAFAPLSTTWSQDLQLELSEQGFAGQPNTTLLQSLLKSLLSYEQRNYSRATKQLATALAQPLTETDRALVQLYLATAYLAQQQAELSLEAFPDLQTLAVTYHSHLQWYQALAWLLLEETEQAKDFLRSIQQDPSYGSKAQLLLKHL